MRVLQYVNIILLEPKAIEKNLGRVSCLSSRIPFSVSGGSSVRKGKSLPRRTCNTLEWWMCDFSLAFALCLYCNKCHSLGVNELSVNGERRGSEAREASATRSPSPREIICTWVLGAGLREAEEGMTAIAPFVFRHYLWEWLLWVLVIASLPRPALIFDRAETGKLAKFLCLSESVVCGNDR